MAIHSSGITHVLGYQPITNGFGQGIRVYLRFPTVEPSLKLPRLYADVVQVVANFPTSSLLSEIAHQRVYLDCVEIRLNREYGNLPTLLLANWAVEGLAYEVHFYP